jgi:hypothetical protein
MTVPSDWGSVNFRGCRFAVADYFYAAAFFLTVRSEAVTRFFAAPRFFVGGMNAPRLDCMPTRLQRPTTNCKVSANSPTNLWRVLSTAVLRDREVGVRETRLTHRTAFVEFVLSLPGSPVANRRHTIARGTRINTP